ncbi:monocarboxylate transporter 9-like [Argopecten irradians]|uniref:monocarboxylate transporter 9-like n=1 Tax=Argopecten irradians TaxID=31199 RepID=UPI00371E5C05
MSYNLCSTRKYTVFAVNFLTLFLCAGFSFNMSVLNLEFLRVFGESKAQTALVQAVTTGVADMAGFFCGQCLNKYGVRLTGMCGGLFIFLGLSASFFATSISFLVVSTGVVAGFGFSLTFGSCFTSVGEYFDGRSQLIAIAVIGIGAGCGSMFFPYFMAYLIEIYGWRGCILLVGGLMGNMIWFFAICTPRSVGVSKQNYHLACTDDLDKKQIQQSLQEMEVVNDNHALEQPQQDMEPIVDRKTFHEPRHDGDNGNERQTHLLTPQGDAVENDNKTNIQHPKAEEDTNYRKPCHQPLHIDDVIDVTNHSLHEEGDNNVCKASEQYTGTEKLTMLMRNKSFIIFILGISLMISSFSSALIYMLEFLHTKGFDEQDALLLYFYMNVSTTISRLLPGLCILIPGIDGLIISACFISISCLSGVGFIFATTYYQHLIIMCVFGMSLGVGNTVLSMTTMELVGLDNYAIALGVITPLLGISRICAGYISGWFVDVTGSYDVSFYSLSASHGLAVVIFTLAGVLRKCCLQPNFP